MTNLTPEAELPPVKAWLKQTRAKLSKHPPGEKVAHHFLVTFAITFLVTSLSFEWAFFLTFFFIGSLNAIVRINRETAPDTELAH